MADYQIEYEAVFLFSALKIVGQFTFGQFEKMIELRDPHESLKGKTVKAAHLQLDAQLKLRALVLFNLPFDHQGKVDAQWDIPLRHLAQMADKGPNLGDGRINISCRSQCSVDWYQQDLWEPDGNQTKVFFDCLLNTIKINKLKFEIIEKNVEEVLLTDMDDLLVIDEDLPALTSAQNNAKKALDISESLAPVLTDSVIVDDEKEDLKKQILINHDKSQQKVAQLLTEQKTKYDLVIQRKNEELEQVKRVLRNEMQADKQMVQALQLKISQLKVLHESLGSTVHDKDEKIDDIQFKYDQQIERYASLKEEYLALVRQQNHHANAQSDDAGITELNDEINSMHIQLEGALNREDDLQKELTAVKAIKAATKASPENDNVLLEKMIAQELIFTAYHPGAGHISIPSRQVNSYLKNPNQFAAQKCSVKLKDYEIWLTHFEQPLCGRCGIDINRVNNPSEFVFTRHAFCTSHR